MASPYPSARNAKLRSTAYVLMPLEHSDSRDGEQSRECQQKAWPGHKAHCKNAAAAREEADSAEVKAHPLLGGQVDDLPSGGDLLSALQGWTGKHRPLLAKSLVYALNLARDPKAHLIKTMIVMVQWMSGQRSTTTRFRVVAADVREIATLGGPTADDILKTRANLDAEHRRKGGFGVAMMVIMCISTSSPMMNIAPVYLHKGITREPRDGDWMDALIAKLG